MVMGRVGQISSAVQGTLKIASAAAIADASRTKARRLMVSSQDSPNDVTLQR